MSERFTGGERGKEGGSRKRRERERGIPLIYIQMVTWSQEKVGGELNGF